MMRFVSHYVRGALVRGGGENLALCNIARGGRGSPNIGNGWTSDRSKARYGIETRQDRNEKQRNRVRDEEYEDSQGGRNEGIGAGRLQNGEGSLETIRRTRWRQKEFGGHAADAAFFGKPHPSEKGLAAGRNIRRAGRSKTYHTNR